MIKTLQKRFVFTAMAAVTLLLCVLIGGLNLANVIVTEQHTDQLLDFLSHTESVPRRDAPRPQRSDFAAPPFNEDTRVSSVHFTATVGETTKVDVRRIATVDEESALEYVKKAVAMKKSDGRVDRFRFRATEHDYGTVYVFLDTSSQTYSMARIALLSLLAGLVAFLLMLVVVMLLSKKAIKPIAENIKRQKQFVTDAGHELKTPIAIILANTEALELHEGKSRWSENIREQADRLSGLTQNLLSLSRADEAQSDTVTEFSLSELIRRTAESFREPMEQRALALFCEADENVMISADEAQVSRILSILFDNALRYAKSESEVEAKLCGRVFTISNECEKLPLCPPEKLFDRFFRGDASRSSEGYGIGLSAAYELAKGKIKAEYTGENKIKFTVDFT